MITLRPYQQKIIDDVRALMQAGERRILIVAPCGAGKTALTTAMLSTAASRGHYSQFVVHRRELLKQSVDAFKNNGVGVGVISPDFKRTLDSKIHIASIFTLKNKYQHYPKPKLMFWDEAQFCGAKTWEKLIEANPQAYHVGLTATPVRLDGKGLGKYFNKIVYGPRMADLIKDGYLCDYDIYAPPSADLSNVKTKYADYEKQELEEVMLKPSITGSAISEYLKHCKDKKMLVFCVSIKHSTSVADQFNSVGIRAMHLDGTTPVWIRDRALHEFQQDKIKIITSVNLFSEGLNIPSIDGVILLRPTQSLGLYIQQIGRAMRPFEGKDKAIILDHAGNWKRHGLPDIDREWSLETRLKPTKSDNSPLESPV